MMTLDEMVMYDRINVFNSSAAEVLCRHCFGLVQAFAEVRSEAGARGDAKAKDRVQYRRLDQYDLVALDKAGMRAPRAEEEVAKRMGRKAKYEKYFADHQ